MTTLEKAVESGDFGAARQILEELVIANPNNPDIYFGLAQTCFNLGDVYAAIAALLQVIEIDTDRHDAWLLLGKSYARTMRLAEARECFGNAERLRPDCAEIKYYLAHVAWKTRDTKAEGLLKEALAIQPDHRDSLVGLAVMYEATNRSDDALPLISRVLGCGNHPLALITKSKILRRKGDYNGAIAALDCIDNADTWQAQKYFEYAALYDVVGDYDKAYENYLAGNSHICKPVDKDAFLREVAAEYNIISKEADAFLAPDDSSPIFLVGFPRSGTTLLDRILAAHPSVQVLEERRSLTAVYHKLNAGLSMDDLRAIYENDVRQHIDRKPDTLLVDKMPLNMTKLRAIRAAYPNAKTLFALRHPADVCLSNFQQNFESNTAMANTHTLADTVRYYDIVMRQWYKSVEVFQPTAHIVRYEKLVSDFDTEVRRMLAFMGLPYHSDIESFNRKARPQNTLSTPSYQAVTESVYTRAAGKWRNYQKYLMPHMSILEPHIKALGY